MISLQHDSESNFNQSFEIKYAIKSVKENCFLEIELLGQSSDSTEQIWITGTDPFPLFQDQSILMKPRYFFVTNNIIRELQLILKGTCHKFTRNLFL